ncbi:unnamed protein product [Musa acuminata subsp. malaccensis]|uniref:(wild Malaysian banana) hypothetical protein n=1 Tax=Musa acuminata subsp. malaccensis TaxID=214687 RepID=A0A804HMC2_MUSAM|nr:unnamed protein product [Musa acuminata subsp. malaccensis]
MPLLRATGPPALADLIRRHVDAGRPVSCVVNNPFLPWVLDVAADLGIPSGVLWVQSCAAQELPSFLLPSSPYKVLAKAILEQFANISKASWVLAKSFEELEHEAIDAISHRLPFIPAPLSVVYVSVGSVAAAEPGLVVAWSPQDRVLAHPAIACFVTHCGWNSTLEALTAGVPVVTYPQWGDQVPGSKFLVEVYGVGGGSSDRHIQAFVDEIRKRAPGGGHVDSDGTI